VEDKTSIVKLLGLPDTFAVVLLTFSFVLLLAPYFSGADFGLFKIPQFTDPARKKLKIIGPIVFLVMLILFVPVIPNAPTIPRNGSDTTDKRSDSHNAQTNSNSNLSTPRDVFNQAQQHLARARDLYARAQYDDALKECDKVLALEPENQDALSLKTSINKTKEILNRNQ
jgi:hypothetical protein